MSTAVAASSLVEDDAVSVKDDAAPLELADDVALLDPLASAKDDEEDAASVALEALLDVDAVAAVAKSLTPAESSA